MVQAMAAYSPEDQKDKDQVWSETALEEETNTTQWPIQGRLFDVP